MITTKHPIRPAEIQSTGLTVPPATVPKSKHRVSAAERHYHIGAALFEWDPYEARENEAYVFNHFVPADLRQIDQLASDLRNLRYQSISPLRATALFTERYQVMLDGTEFEWHEDSISGLKYGLVDASLANFGHMWNGRQHADVLGMEYDDYIRAVFLVHQSLGNKVAPSPRQMHGVVALAAASFEKRAAQVESQRSLNS